jgi:hypothetical protein
MVSVWHFNVANLRAKLPGVTGTLELDPKKPFRSKFAVAIEASSITTGHPRQEEFMRSESWLDATSSMSRLKVNSWPAIKETATVSRCIGQADRLDGRRGRWTCC